MQNILKKSTQEDRGFINRPVLTPHLQFRIIEKNQVILVSEFFNTLISGKIYSNLFPLLDGSQTLDQIVSNLAKKHSASDVFGVIFALSARGYIVSADHTLPQGQASYWSALGVTPRWAEEQLRNATFQFMGGEYPLADILIKKGAKVVDTNAAITVVECFNYLESHLHALNKRFLEETKTWILVQPHGIQAMVGPVFQSNGVGPCWDCLATRLRCHQEVHEYLRNVGGDKMAFKPGLNNINVQESVLGLIAAEIMKWFVLGDQSPLDTHVITMHSGKLEITKHKVVRRPQCLSCGDKALYDPTRQPKPIKLEAESKAILASGGIRTVTPEETLAKYKHLVSPISGVASWLARTTEETDPWLHVYWAGSNHGLKINSLSSLRRSLRSNSAGKGTNTIQSQVSALCEAIERYSGGFLGDEIRTKKCFKDFSKEDNAINPNTVQLFSEQQLENAETINSEGHPYNVIPQKFDPYRVMEWTPVWSFTQNRHRYLPTTMLYIMPQEYRNSSDLIADTNGCAAGNTMEEAILQGFYELVERDAFSIWWYNQLRKPSVNLTNFDDDFLNQAKSYYEKYERDIWVLDITSDITIPTYVAISNKPCGKTEDIIYGAGSHPDAKTAVKRALCELNQCLTWLPHSSKNEGRPAIDDPMVLAWWQNGCLKNCHWLVPNDSNPLRPISQNGFTSRDLKEEVEYCQSLVEEKQMELLVLDQTRPDIGLNVVRVIVPGMRHFWPRWAPGRLYDVPVNMGYFSTPLSESELNPVPVLA